MSEYKLKVERLAAFRKDFTSLLYKYGFNEHAQVVEIESGKVAHAFAFGLERVEDDDQLLIGFSMTKEGCICPICKGES